MLPVTQCARLRVVSAQLCEVCFQHFPVLHGSSSALATEEISTGFGRWK